MHLNNIGQFNNTNSLRNKNRFHSHNMHNNSFFTSNNSLNTFDNNEFTAATIHGVVLMSDKELLLCASNKKH